MFVTEEREVMRPVTEQVHYVRCDACHDTLSPVAVADDIPEPDRPSIIIFNYPGEDGRIELGHVCNWECAEKFFVNPSLLNARKDLSKLRMGLVKLLNQHEQDCIDMERAGAWGNAHAVARKMVQGVRSLITDIP